MKALRSLALVGSFLFCLTFHAQAALLGVAQNDSWLANPNLGSDTLQVTYDATSLQAHHNGGYFIVYGSSRECGHTWGRSRPSVCT